MRFHDFKPLFWFFHYEVHLLNYCVEVILNNYFKRWGSIIIFSVNLLNFVDISRMVLKIDLNDIFNIKHQIKVISDSIRFC